MANKQHFKAHGKLLISSEYFVLDGALALAVPTVKGQEMTVTAQAGEPTLHWQAYNSDGQLWMDATFSLPDLTLASKDTFEAKRLEQVLQATHKLSPDFLNQPVNYLVETRLQFPNEWGLGSSSTLIYNIAQWAGVDAFELLRLTFGGSGYDIACAGANGPITYQLKARQPVWQPVVLYPSFAGGLYFVYLGHKQDSREGIARYREVAKEHPQLVERFSQLTHNMLHAKDLDAFRVLMEQHEDLVANHLQLPKVRQQFFDDLPGSVKSLGAWGGDMVLVATEMPETELKEYLQKRNFNTCIAWNDLILHA